MPDLEVSIPYKSCVLGLLRFLTLFSFPFWGVLAPIQIMFSVFGLLFMIPLFIFGAGSGNLLWVLAPLYNTALHGAIAYLGIRAVMVTGDSNIVLNENGISFPVNFWFPLRFRRHRKWTEFVGINVSDNKLGFVFGSGAQATINLKSLKEGQKEQLLLGLKVWSRGLELQTKVAGLLEQIDKKHTENKGLSYTQLWEEQVNRHFSSTAFVPLAQGAALQSGRIKVIGPIAFGGLSAVYLAQLNSAETVVLKELVTDDVSDDQILKKSQEMFEREARILIELRDPRIARVLDHFVENNRSYLVLEHINGENLRSVVLQAGPRSEREAVTWALQLAEILDFIHSQNPPIIHRDISPDNLVLRNGKEIVLIDFGAANTFLGTATGTLVGKQSYISPEQFRGKPAVQSDIYSFGATLFFLLTGQDPEPLNQSRPSTLKSNISTAVDRLVAACTEFDLNKRPQSARDLILQLRAVSDAAAASVE